MPNRRGVVILVTAAVLGPLRAQQGDHPHPHDAEHLHHHADAGRVWTIDDVLALGRNQRVSAERRVVGGRSGDGDLAFSVQVTADRLPKEVFAANPHDGKRKRSILECAHGGFAYDYRPGKGEVYWHLQGAGILRIQRDRSKIVLLPTDPAMRRLNLHNATFFVHKGQARIAWPAERGARVFLTDVDGKVVHVVPKPTVKPYSDGAAYAPTDTAYLDGKLWVTDGYASKYVMSYDLDRAAWTGQIFGGPTRKIEPGKFGTNHGITILENLIYVSGRQFARIHTYKPDTTFTGMFPLPDGSRPCDFEFFVLRGKLYGVAASLDKPTRSKDRGASIYIVDMKTLKVVSTIKPRDELGLDKFVHLHNVFPTVEDGLVTLFCQAWNGGDFAVLRQVAKADAKAAAPDPQRKR
ncbi:MAG: hypothetical protein KDC87_00905 [Planctomycetes bacterium]|nr:hypothetical protein [Planctomycetota bacterium]MCB9868835.1 hypothetical protein [Planctomycetota bacterium]MCB9889549.1 hypothetical protein [Planctomycetota bacterium]